MLFGAHVSPAGGLHRAIERGAALGCDAIQIFNQSPRRWQASVHGEEEIARFNHAMAASRVQAVVIHAVYLLNCATRDAAIRRKSLASLTHSLRFGAAIGARGVVLHAGSAKTGRVPAAIARAGRTIRAALADSEHCPLLLENTAGAGGTLGRSVSELASLLAAAGDDARLGVCLDSAHLLASGYDIRTATGMDEVLGAVQAEIGQARIGCLHLNDSLAPLASNRDRHANLARGELGRAGCAAFLGAPSLTGLPCVLETPGDGDGPTAAELALARRLARQGARQRARA